VQAGADVLVAGSFVFKSPGGPVATLAGLRQLLRAAGEEAGVKN
jgi:ribulose-phosphate 3-epimerase